MIDLGAQVIECCGDSEIIVKQVRNKIHCLSPHFLNYQKLVRDMTNSFKDLNIKSVPRSQKFDADLLSNTASRIIPPEGLSPDTFSIELMYRPSILDNVTNWNVFYDDLQILDLLTTQDTFKVVAIDGVEHDKYLSKHGFPSNLIPKSIINMEKYNDLHDKFKGNPNYKTNSSSLNFKTVNLGNEQQNHQLINIGVSCSP